MQLNQPTDKSVCGQTEPAVKVESTTMLFICVCFHIHTLTSSLCHTNICLAWLLVQANGDDSRGVIVMIYVLQQHTC